MKWRNSKERELLCGNGGGGVNGGGRDSVGTGERNGGGEGDGDEDLEEGDEMPLHPHEGGPQHRQHHVLETCGGDGSSSRGSPAISHHDNDVTMSRPSYTSRGFVPYSDIMHQQTYNCISPAPSQDDDDCVSVIPDCNSDVELDRAPHDVTMT